MRLIDADALMGDINDSIDEMTRIGIAVDGDWLWAKLNDAIANAPTIDAVEVVRCKDCRHFFRDDMGNVVVYRCELNHEDMRDDFYCADGERGEDE